jgi:hypothetical protein
MVDPAPSSTAGFDWNYVYALIALVIGVAAGFQGVYERYKKGAGKASRTLPGATYLLSRGLLPGAGFVAALNAGYIVLHPLLTAVVCGAGAETFLRTQFYVKRRETKSGEKDDVLAGPFDLLRWYQNFFLESAGDNLAKSRLKYVRASVPSDVSFPELCDRLERNLGAWTDARAKQALLEDIAKFRAAYAAASSPSNEQYRMQLGFRVLDEVGRSGLQTLFS